MSARPASSSLVHICIILEGSLSTILDESVLGHFFSPVCSGTYVGFCSYKKRTQDHLLLDEEEIEASVVSKKRIAPRLTYRRSAPDEEAEDVRCSIQISGTDQDSLQVTFVVVDRPGVTYLSEELVGLDRPLNFFPALFTQGALKQVTYQFDLFLGQIFQTDTNVEDDNLRVAPFSPEMHHQKQ